MHKHSSYILFLLISILLVILNMNGVGIVDSAQKSLNDLLIRLNASEGIRPNIVLVTIDGQAEDQYGNWPWNRDLIADLTAATAAGDPAAILIDLKLPENRSQDSAGYTTIMANQLKWIDQAVLGYDIALATYRGSRINNPKYLFENSVQVNNPLGLMQEKSSLLARKVFLPAKRLLAGKPYLGFDYDSPDDDRILRHQPTVINYEGYYYPSQALLATAVYLKVPPDQIEVIEGIEIRLGQERRIPINERGEYFIRFAEQPAFAQYSAAEVLSENFDRNKFKGKLVMIGVDDYIANESFATPMNDRMSPLLIKATIAENIINKNMVVMGKRASPILLIILLALGGICAFVMPRMTLMYRMLILGGLLVILANVSYFMLSSFQMLPQTLYIGLQLIIFMAAAPVLDLEMLSAAAKPTAGSRTKPKSISTNRRKKKSASDDIPAFREIVSSPSDPENLATRALNYLKSRTTGGSATSDEAELNTQMVDHQTIDADAVVEADTDTSAVPFDPQAISLDETPKPDSRIPMIITPDAGVSDSAKDSDGIDSDKVRLFDNSNITHLGRYQVESVLGKGAMGLVYKGIDPAISRPVALKTIRLDFVNDPEEMEELKERLFREAQAAGKLSHPNIVTIYDVGSEGHLQYIAMEYLEGQTLEELIKKKVKFNYRIIAQIIQQICAALDYAHDKGIVHRDIKPANIMILQNYLVKVMDYGIARIDSNSMTKTGIAMGTPNYISPEQLKGQSIDRRADLFSLGVLMYEMLLGQRPFRGDNITQLIYAITTHEPTKPSEVNPEVPLLFDHIVTRALKKDPIARYQKASEISSDLSDFVASFAVR